MSVKRTKRLGNKKESPKRIVVVLEGGLVRNIISEIAVEAVVKDIDEGSEEEVVYTLWESNEVVVAPQLVQDVFDAMNEKESKGGCVDDQT